jgi:putative membrane protein
MKSTLMSIIVLITPAFFAPAQAAPGINDAQIAAIAITANLIDIEAGKLAQFKSSNTEVQFFAQRLVTDHGVTYESLTELIKRIKITPQDNPTSQSLKSEAQKNVAKLTRLRGAAFEREYIDHEVAFHRQMLETIDKVLLPNVENELLKGSLAKMRPAFFSHLKHALRMQASLSQL